VTLTVCGDEEGLPAALEPVFFRLIQEGLNNIIKHADVRHAQIELDLDSGHVGRLVIRDDGVGFDPATLPSSDRGNMGLRQMRERVAMVGGSFSVESVPTQGTTLRAEIPLRGTL
jgi:signal transduction histidine kinase